ncbi:MAG: aminopeptidase, partial [Methanobacteriota archaeon]
TFKTCLGIERDETVLLLTDSEMADASKMVFEAVKPLTRELLVMSISPRSVHGEELPMPAARAMAASDVVIGVTSRSMTHTEATRAAVKEGARVASMPGVTVEMLTEGGMTADYRAVAEEARRISGILSSGSEISVETGLGTRFVASIEGREGYADTGLLVRRGDFGNLPGGEGFIAPVEGTGRGRIVFDGAIAGSGLLHRPVSVEVEEGKARSTDSEELERIFREVDNAAYVGEIGIGVNPRARLTGNILEDEKVLGTVHIAFGNNLGFGGSVDAGIHLDGIIKEPTVKVDGRVVLKKGQIC